ncbi:replication protein A 32 kDa subunit B isoform X3 [Zea mays]|uniref:Replication protein A 32 kDa subunit A n=1 Tax=Zea mays TaxID=4577 RepID=A0A804PLR2_MAIZE|nr:replication protein A 32 kDa subunit B isoform X3 [Zea mays]|eukprot:XP_008645968.1 replication protein A 32 kDa subunit B isoform X3 [Zea mays]
MYGGGGGGGHYDGGSGGAGNANALFGGGGFMPSQSTVVPENSGLSKGRSAQTLLPLTVKQTMDAAQTSGDRSNFAINGVEVSTIRLVGRMLGKVERVTDVVFTLDDGTGKIDVNRWENEASDAKEMADANNENYVIVIGGLKGFQGKRHVVAYAVRRVTNFNEITCHFLHCIQVHMELTGLKVDGNYISNLVLSVFHDPSVMDQEHGLHIKDVIDRLKLPDDVVRTRLAACFPAHRFFKFLVVIISIVLVKGTEPLTGGTSATQFVALGRLLRAAIQGHVDVGNIYNTIDDFHYKSVRNG